ncbi:hypothetical protein D3Z45_10825 [Lachnospiraceae bacterium]|nr:hypothetical protein [Lachnospiraceae bacterium]
MISIKQGGTAGIVNSPVPAVKLGRDFFMRTGGQMKCVSKLTDARRASSGEIHSPTRLHSPVLWKK